ncbi:hypothetical protein [Vibrio owensii]|uniref:Uncharacterized protein n=1 Tax=Vibrio owensii CAIM 1854 = LMG 25443 TaxID=1229493 RepID=A0A0C1ZLV4_9VIBR|nr:hypothetical protein [Vibrio owensii]KIF54086.1 hypothetical protein H735_06770 [Vibrio owensii CAIM 1854 = LMG 25443]
MIPLHNNLLLGADKYQFILYKSYPNSKPRPQTYHPKLEQVARKILTDELYINAKEAESLEHLVELFEVSVEAVTSHLKQLSSMLSNKECVCQKR